MMNPIDQFYFEVAGTDYALETTCELTFLPSLPEAPVQFPQTIQPGTYLVGIEIQAGTYQGQAGQDPAHACYWARLDGLSGGLIRSSTMRTLRANSMFRLPRAMLPCKRTVNGREQAPDNSRFADAPPSRRRRPRVPGGACFSGGPVFLGCSGQLRAIMTPQPPRRSLTP